ncbi:ABC transporter substrate-binding protein [Bordetella sp. LUAb4]|uniref:ABC transporter substrate-binding protein n=1 Tax=Bordetella sp. LUAb4 TaxID=2843195 RepID=UPI001E2FBA9E|nr:PhnD/SsuA/transferrin family substrate-binding protein [Bordetella sp. LUAb4]
MNRRDFLQTAGAAVALGLLPGALNAALAAEAQDKKKVRITLPSAGSAGSAWRPLVEKYKLDQDLGIALDWVTADPGKMQVQLSAGSLDVGVFGSVGLATLANRGSDIVLFGPALNNHGRWIVRGDSPYKSPKDLIGKRIATTAETSETYQQARIAASLTGLDLKKDVKVIFGSPTANLALFERGDVDGIITLEPTATRLVGRGAREIARVADIWKEATGQTDDPFLVGLAASKTWYEQNQATAAKLATLFERIGTTIAAHPDSLKPIAAELGLKADETQAIDLLPQRLAPTYATKWDASVFATIDKQIEVAVKLGLLDAAPSRKLYVKA